MIRKFLIAALLMFSATAGAWAQEESTSDKKEEVRMSDQASDMQLASDLAKYGYANNSASSLIESAKILKNAGFKQANDEKAEHSSTDNNAKQKDNSFALDVDKLLADATKLASGDKNLLAMVDAVKKSATRGVNSSYSYDRVSAHSTDTWSVDFSSTGWHYVYVSGDGDTDLDVYVYDCNGNFKGKDIRYGDNCYVSFYVGNTYCKYKIQVKNLGGVYNNYYLTTGRE